MRFGVSKTKFLKIGFIEVDFFRIMVEFQFCYLHFFGWVLHLSHKYKGKYPNRENERIGFVRGYKEVLCDYLLTRT